MTAIEFAATPDRPTTIIRAAKEALDRDGIEELKVWLAERNRSRPKQRTLIVDPQGAEILGQRLRAASGLWAAAGRGFRRDDGPRSGEGFRPGDGPRPGEGPPPSEGPRIIFPPMPPPDGARWPGGERREPPSRTQIFFRMLGGDGLRWVPFFLRGKDGSVYRVFFDPPPRRGPLSPPFSGWVRAALLAVALGVGGLVSYLLARSISTPVRKLQTAAHTFVRQSRRACWP